MAAVLAAISLMTDASEENRLRDAGYTACQGNAVALAIVDSLKARGLFPKAEGAARRMQPIRVATGRT